MNTKEKLEQKLKNTGDRIYGTLLLVQDYEDEKAKQEVSHELNIDQDTTEKLFCEMREYKKDKKNLKMLSYLAQNCSSEVSLYKDVVKAQKRIKYREENLMNSINMVKFDCFISEIDSKVVTKEVIEYLNENNVDDSIRQKAIQKFAANLNAEPMKCDDLFDFLYKNNYKATGNNTSLDGPYKYYEQSRKKDENIKSLENEIMQKEDEIDGKNNEIRVLNMQVKYYEQAVPNVQQRIKDCVKKAQRSVFSVKELQKQAEVKEHTGIFLRAFQKIKGILRRDKPLLLSASLKEIQNEMSNLTDGLTEVGDSITKPESKENILEHLQRRKQLSLGLNKMAEPMKSR